MGCRGEPGRGEAVWPSGVRRSGFSPLRKLDSHFVVCGSLCLICAFLYFLFSVWFSCHLYLLERKNKMAKASLFDPVNG